MSVCRLILRESGLPRYLHSAVLLSGTMLVFGGNTHNDTSLSNGAKCFSADFLAYDIGKNNSWRCNKRDLFPPQFAASGMSVAAVFLSVNCQHLPGATLKVWGHSENYSALQKVFIPFEIIHFFQVMANDSNVFYWAFF